MDVPPVESAYSLKLFAHQKFRRSIKSLVMINFMMSPIKFVHPCIFTKEAPTPRRCRCDNPYELAWRIKLSNLP